MTKVVDGEVLQEVKADDPRFVRTVSETAASASNRLYGPSGVMPYRVVLANGAAMSAVIVDAATGDEAAEKALTRNPGQKVAYVGPATASDSLPDLTQDAA